MVLCAAGCVIVCYRLGRRREKLMCAAVSVMLCYREGDGGKC